MKLFVQRESQCGSFSDPNVAPSHREQRIEFWSCVLSKVLNKCLCPAGDVNQVVPPCNWGSCYSTWRWSACWWQQWQWDWRQSRKITSSSECCKYSALASCRAPGAKVWVHNTHPFENAQIFDELFSTNPWFRQGGNSSCNKTTSGWCWVHSRAGRQYNSLKESTLQDILAADDSSYITLLLFWPEGLCSLTKTWYVLRFGRRDKSLYQVKRYNVIYSTPIAGAMRML